MGNAAPEHDRLARFLDRAATKLMYKPIAVVASLVGGMLASALFARIWQALAGRKEVPGATDQATTWADILPAAALHGIVFGIVKALVDRAGAKEFQRLTGRWPGNHRRAEAAQA